MKQTEIKIQVVSGGRLLGEFANLGFAVSFVEGIVNKNANVPNFDISIVKRTYEITAPDPKKPEAPKAPEAKKQKESAKEKTKKMN